jgi:hypothetical protein
MRGPFEWRTCWSLNWIHVDRNHRLILLVALLRSFQIRQRIRIKMHSFVQDNHWILLQSGHNGWNLLRIMDHPFHHWIIKSLHKLHPTFPESSLFHTSLLNHLTSSMRSPWQLLLTRPWTSNCWRNSSDPCRSLDVNLTFSPLNQHLHVFDWESEWKRLCSLWY